MGREMEVIGPIIIAPAIAALVFAIAFGSRNPIRWAAWGAILGPVVAILLLIANTNTKPVAYAPTYTPTNEQPAQAAPAPTSAPYKVPESEQVRVNKQIPQLY
jgi:hypothetical protein